MRSAGLLLVWAFVFFAAVTASALYHLDLPESRELVRRWLVDTVDDEIKGRLEIETLESLRFGGIRARNVTLFEPSGHPVLSAETVSLRVSLRSLPAGIIRVDRPTLRNVSLVLREGEELFTFLDAFAPTKPSTGPVPVRVLVERASIQGAVVSGDFLDLRGLRAELSEGLASIDIGDEVRFQLLETQGKIEQPFPFVGEIQRASLDVHTDPARGVRAEVVARADRAEGADQIEASVALRDENLDLTVEAHPVHMETLADVGFAWAKPLRGTAQGTFALHGPLEDLRMTASLQTAGGSVEVRGELAPSQTHLTVETPAIDPAQIVDGAPSTTVRGRAELVVPSDASRDTVFRVEADGFTLLDYTVPPTRASGTVDAEGNLSLQSIVARSGIVHARGSGNVDADGRVELRLEGAIEAVEREPNVHRILPQVRGRLQFDVAVSSRGNSGKVAGDIVASNLELEGFRAGRVQGAGSIQWSEHDTQVDVLAEGLSSGLGGYALGATRAQLRGSLRRLEVDLRSEPQDGRKISINTVIHASGSDYRAPNTRILVRAGSEVWEGGVKDVVVSGNGGVRFGDSFLHRGRHGFTGSGLFASDGNSDLHFDFQDADVQALSRLLGIPTPPLDAHVDARLTLSGDRENLEFRVEGAMHRASFLDVRSAESAFVVAYRDGVMTINAQGDLGGLGVITVSGQVLTDPDESDLVKAVTEGVFDLDVRASRLHLAAAKSWYPPPYDSANGQLFAKAHIGGSLFAPEVRLTMSSPQLELSSWPALQLRAVGAYEHGYLAARTTLADETGPLLETELGLLLDVVHLLEAPQQTLASLENLPWRVSFRVEERKVSELPAPIVHRVPALTHDLRFALSGSLAGGAFASAGQVFAKVRWDGPSSLRCDSTTSPFALVDARLEDGVTQVTFRGFAGERLAASATASAKTPLDSWLAAGTLPQSLATSFEAELRDVNLSSLPGLCRRVSGSLRGSLSATDVGGAAPTATWELLGQSIRAFRQDPFELDWRGTTDGTELSTEGSLVWETGKTRFEATLPIAGEDDSETVLFAEFQDAPLAPWAVGLPAVTDARGVLDGTVQGIGRGNDVTLQGEVRLVDGALTLPTIGQHFQRIDGGLIFKENRIEIDELEVEDGDANAQIDGHIAFRGWLPASAKLFARANRFPLRQEGSVLAYFTSTAIAEASFDPGEGRVSVDLMKAELDMPDPSDREVISLRDHPDVTVVGIESASRSETSSYPITIAVDGTRSFWLKRNDFAVRVRVEIEGTYDAPDFLVAGYAELQEGYFELYGKRFEVDWGTINFDGTEQFDPGVNLSATHNLSQSGSVTVTVAGTMQHPEIRFSSTEATDKAEILSLLLSGRARDGDAEDADQQAADFLINVASAAVTLPLRQGLGDVVPDVGLEGGRLRARWRADWLVPEFLKGTVRGAYLTGRFAVADESSSGGSSDETDAQASPTSEIILELLFPRDLVLEGMYIPPDKGRIDLIWEP